MLVDLLNELDVITHDESIDVQSFFDFQRIKHGINTDQFTRSKYNFFEAFNFTDSIYYDVRNVTSYSWRIYRFFPGFIPAMKKNKIFDGVKLETYTYNIVICAIRETAYIDKHADSGCCLRICDPGSTFSYVLSSTPLLSHHKGTR